MTKLGIAKSIGDNQLSSENDSTIPRMKDTVYLKPGSTLRPKNARYIFVAKKQMSKFAVIGVYTFDEKTKFTRLMNEKYNNVNGSPNFLAFAIKWNSQAVSIMPFYKTSEHIEKWYNHWKEQESARKTHSVHHTVIDLCISK